MTIVTDFPPNYEDILQAIPEVKNYQAIFTYGDTIHNPHAIYIDPALKAHEAWHTVQQSRTSPQEWWNEYLLSPAFRLQEEAECYTVQYAYAKEHYNRAQCRQLLDHITKALSSSLYGNLINKDEARERIVK